MLRGEAALHVRFVPAGLASSPALIMSLAARSAAGVALLARPERPEEAREGLRCPVRSLGCPALSLASLTSGLCSAPVPCTHSCESRLLRNLWRCVEVCMSCHPFKLRTERALAACEGGSSARELMGHGTGMRERTKGGAACLSAAVACTALCPRLPLDLRRGQPEVDHRLLAMHLHQAQWCQYN